MDEIIDLIQPFYTREELEKIEKELRDYIATLPQIKLESFSHNWYKDSNIYMVYPDSIFTEKDSPLKALVDYLPQIKALGCNAIHLLPFLQSPMYDKGFDVSSYYQIREGLGGMQDMLYLKKEADRLEIQIFMDLIFNHVSKEHEWFIKAQNGDEYYRNFFIYTKDTPQFLGKVYRHETVYAEYLVDGEKTFVTIAFPEFAGELPHWVQGKDGYWYYHTYYPSQVDLNWKNPHVFLELAKVLLYWASRGFHFRFDAIPFVGKSAYKHLNTHNPLTHHLAAAFNILARQVNPNCTFILEVNEHFKAETEYFGTANLHQAHLLYNFQLTLYLWVSLVEYNIRYVWRKLQRNKQIPMHGQWINFLRNHDELSLSNLNDTLMQEMRKKLLPYGKTFREGYGIAGRTYSFLDSDEKRFLMAYFLLASFPGSMLIPYGDEYAMGNIPQSKLSLLEQSDTRNINRGPLTDEIMQSEKGKRIFSEIKNILEKREFLRNYLNVWPEEIVSVGDKGIFAAKYKLGTSEMVIFINITPHVKMIEMITGAYQEIMHINSVSVEERKLRIGPYGGIWLQK